MILDLKSLFAEEVISISLDHFLDLTDIEFSGIYPFESPVHLTGAIICKASVVELCATVEFELTAPCDRCAAVTTKKMSLPMEHIIVTSVSSEENDEWVVVEDMKLDIRELTVSDILLYLPTKYLCDENCKGLCVSCGKNLNEGNCSCLKTAIDPRLEKLKNLID